MFLLEKNNFNSQRAWITILNALILSDTKFIYLNYLFKIKKVNEIDFLLYQLKYKQ